jgi:hypothetical protein
MTFPILALGIVFTAGAHALETLSSGQLLALCQSDSGPEAAVCTGYINGFLDGAFATDPRAAESVESEIGEEESFSERAMRTRLGTVTPRYEPSHYADFCISADMPVDAIRTELKDSMMQDSDSYRQENAREYLYELLQNKHPC